MSPLLNPATVTAQWNSRDVRVLLGGLAPRQWAFATAVALTRTGQHVKAAEEGAIETSFDRPTDWTRRGLFLQKATPQQPHARVWFKDFAPKGTAAGKYLMPQVHGGQRSDKRFERSLQRSGLLSGGRQLVPASGIRSQLDSHGNVPRGIYTQILSQLRSSADATQNQTARTARRGRRSGRAQYFYATIGKHRGVWVRLPGDRVLGGRMRSTIAPVFLEQPPHTYRPRFAFFSIAERVATARYQAEFAAAAEQTLRTAR